MYSACQYDGSNEVLIIYKRFKVGLYANLFQRAFAIGHQRTSFCNLHFTFFQLRTPHSTLPTLHYLPDHLLPELAAAAGFGPW